MPIYIYEHPITQERKEIVQRMREEHIYKEGDIEWKRVFEAPQASTGATIGTLDPFDKRAFIEKTGKMRGITQGQLWDLSGEMSEKRAKKVGKDPIKEKAKNIYKKRTDKAHPLG